MMHIYCSNRLDDLRPGSSGKPLPGYELKILDEAGHPVAQGEAGDLYVKGDSALALYWAQHEKSKRSILGEWFFSGDRYRVDADGFYWYEGRSDDMIKVGGLWVSPIEIESVLLKHKQVPRPAGANYECEEYDVTADKYMRTGEPIPAATWKELEKSDSILFGAVGDPRVNDATYLAGVLLRLRFELDLYVNLRPAKLYDDRLSPLRREGRREIDLLIVRENTEGLYVGMGGRFKRGTEDEVAIQEDLNTYKGVTRIIAYAFGHAKRELALVDKSNAMTYQSALWQEVWKACTAKP